MILNDNYISVKLEIEDVNVKVHHGPVEDEIHSCKFTPEMLPGSQIKAVDPTSVATIAIEKEVMKPNTSAEEPIILDEDSATDTQVESPYTVNTVDPPACVGQVDKSVNYTPVKQPVSVTQVDQLLTVTPVDPPLTVTPVDPPLTVTPVKQPVTVTQEDIRTVAPLIKSVTIHQAITPAVMLSSPALVAQAAVSSKPPQAATREVSSNLETASQLMKDSAVAVKSPVHIDHAASEQPKEETVSDASQLDQINSRIKRFFQRDITYHKWPERKHIKVRLLCQIQMKNFTIVEDIPLYDQHCNKIIEDIANYIKTTDETSYSPL